MKDHYIPLDDVALDDVVGGWHTPGNASDRACQRLQDNYCKFEYSGNTHAQTGITQALDSACNDEPNAC